MNSPFTIYFKNPAQIFEITCQKILWWEHNWSDSFHWRYAKKHVVLFISSSLVTSIFQEPCSNHRYCISKTPGPIQEQTKSRRETLGLIVFKRSCDRSTLWVPGYFMNCVVLGNFQGSSWKYIICSCCCGTMWFLKGSYTIKKLLYSNDFTNV